MKTYPLRSNLSLTGTTIVLALLLLAGSAQQALSQTNTFPSTGNAGVGTTSPSYPLDVLVNAQWVARFKKTDATNGGIIIDATAGYNPNLALSVNGGVKWYMNSNSSNSDSLQFWESTGSIPRFTLTQAGNVGIGAPAPAAKLSVGGNGANIYATDLWIENNLHVQGNEGLGQGGRGRLRIGTAWGYPGLYSDASSTGTGNDLVLGAGSGTVRVGPGVGSTQNFIVPNGNVGIGTTNPQYGRLQVNKSVRIDDDSGSSIGSDTLGGAAILYLGTTSGGGSFQFNGSGGIDLWQYNNAAWGRTVTFAKAGNVGIGTTSPGYKLDVAGQIRSSAGGFMFPDGTVQTTAASGGGGSSQWTGPSTIYYNSGNVGIGNSTPAQVLHVQKDQNLDTNILVQNDTAGTSAQADVRVKNNTGALGQLGIYSSTHSAYGALAGGDVHVYSSTNLALMADNSSGTIKFTTGGNAERARIDSSGNVGIGTSNPTSKLHVTGDGKFTGNLTVDGNINAKYQDMAEWVPSSEQLLAGTVVVLDTTKSNQVVCSTQSYDTRVAGVISAQPGITLGESGEGKVLVATTGRVLVQVDASKSPIHIGDLLVTSDVPGMAMKSEPVNLSGIKLHRPGTIVGKALESLEKGSGRILVLLSLQ